MGTRDLEWIDVGDGAGGRAAQGHRGGRKPSAERRERRREEARLQEQRGTKKRTGIEVIGIYARPEFSENSRESRKMRLQVEEIRQGKWVSETRKDALSGEDRQRGSAGRRKQAGTPDGQMAWQESNAAEGEWEEDPEGEWEEDPEEEWEEDPEEWEEDPESEWEEVPEEWEEDTGTVLTYREKESGGRRPEAEEAGRERQRKRQQIRQQQNGQQHKAPGKKEQPKREQQQKKRRRARNTKRMLMVTSFFAVVSIVLGAALAAGYIYQELEAGKSGGGVPAANVQTVEETPIPQDIREWAPFYAASLERPELAVDLLTVNEYSRPGEALPEVKNIFIHYTANVGTTAEQNKSYFQSLAETHERSASAHFIIGFDGVIVQCIPTAEIAYAVKERNYDSISIECCFLDESGQFTQETYDKLIELTAWLLHKFELEPEDVLRHYDEGGKICPKYYVEHEEAWQQFLRDLERYMERVAADAVRNGQ